MIDRSRRYLYHIVVEVEERHMPAEIALPCATQNELLGDDADVAIARSSPELS